MRAEIRDASYWYEVYGEGETIVLLHGFTGSTKTWSTFIDTYQSQFKIIVIDLPGHGKTVTPSIISMEQCCHDIHAILTEIGVEAFHLVGYSMGGRTALSYCMLYPDRIKSLVLESASPGLKTKEERNTRIANDEKLARMIEQDGIEAFINFWENIPLFQSQQKLSVAKKEALRIERLSHTKEGLIISLKGMGTGSQTSWWNALSKFEKPVLLLVGEMDKKFMNINKEMNKVFQNSDILVCNNVGHAIHVEVPEFFGKIVEEFVLKISNT